ncbi:hypothetical protein SFRURICE_002619 [Spodoptera frugiperda]|nr:hypothetical protein SFRURICE_002619 [Spodoptera frugiperda]
MFPLLRMKQIFGVRLFCYISEIMDLIRDEEKILHFLNESDSENDDLELACQPGELSGSEEEENNYIA